jgi:hypothetical protein
LIVVEIQLLQQWKQRRWMAAKLALDWRLWLCSGCSGFCLALSMAKIHYYATDDETSHNPNNYAYNDANWMAG